MAIKFINNRQYPRTAVAVLNAGFDLGSELLLPPRSLVTGGGYTVITAVGGTSPTLTLVDDAGSPFTFLSAVDVSAPAAGNLASNSVGRYYGAGAKLTFTTGGTPTAGTGKVLFHLTYIEELAENELYGRADG